MKLQDLRPHSGVNMGELNALITGREWTAGIPSALPEKLLLELVYDFRAVERGLTVGGKSDETVEGFGSTLYIVSALLATHPSRKKKMGKLSISLEKLTDAIQAYQWCLEREISTRILGKRPQNHTSALLSAMSKFLDG
jgi:hypothetical protein